jgi:hypothetical protein
MYALCVTMYELCSYACAQTDLPNVFTVVTHAPIETIDAHAGEDESHFPTEDHSAWKVRALEEVCICPTLQTLDVPDVTMC